ncbi:MAG: hypoxanthine phosphoribosyltransferase [Planctomycetota bacterium]|nr:hypoxanthine phosphoribosyltransferase [Planctomycetota bacterium]
MELSLKDFEVFIKEETIQARIAEMAEKICADFEGKDLVAVGVLKGSFVFMADLVRHLPPETTCDFLRVSSYEGVKSTGKVRIDFDLTQPIQGKDVLIIEDIIDTGLTMHCLMQRLSVRGANSISLCTLLDKPSRRKDDVDVSVNYCGFKIENRFVLGYGLDLDGKYRNLRDVYALRSEVEEAAGY